MTTRTCDKCGKKIEMLDPNDDFCYYIKDDIYMRCVPHFFKREKDNSIPFDLCDSCRKELFTNFLASAYK